MDKSTGEPLLINEQQITAELEFTPTSSEGTVAVSYTHLDVYKRQHLKPGMKGTVVGMDDQPALLVNWDNGGNLSLLIGKDPVSYTHLPSWAGSLPATGAGSGRRRSTFPLNSGKSG